MSDLDQILAANRAFYQAFATRDRTAMEATWSRTMALSCIHPGWPPLIGRDDVMKSWREILSNPRAPDIRVRDEHAVLHGTTGIVVCVELIRRMALAAANVFVREGGLWLLVHHQAGAVAAAAPEAPPRQLH